jgi:hypothetical protein
MAYNNFLLGAVTGVAVTATGLYLYHRNQEQVDAFLRSQGINVPTSAGRDFAQMEMEELVAAKERIEDLIAEMEFAQKKAKKGTAKKRKAKKAA